MCVAFRSLQRRGSHCQRQERLCAGRRSIFRAQRCRCALSLPVLLVQAEQWFSPMVAWQGADHGQCAGLPRSLALQMLHLCACIHAGAKMVQHQRDVSSPPQWQGSMYAILVCISLPSRSRLQGWGSGCCRPLAASTVSVRLVSTRA